MGDILEEPYECSCSAIYRNRKGLDAHLAEIQIQKAYHTAQLEKCFAHSRSDDDGHICDGSCVGLCATCPHDACKPRSTAYKTSAKLVRHYGIHVACDEVCVFCCIRFEQTHKFLRHVEECHKKDTGRKAEFMVHTCRDLVSIVSRELHVAQHRKLYSDMNSNGKRMRVVSDINSGTLDTERAGKTRVLGNGHQTAQAAAQPSSSLQPTAPFMEMPTGGGISSVDRNGPVDMNSVDMNRVAVMSRVDMNGFGDVSSELEGLRNFYYAPILQMVSSPATFWEAPVQ